jgi:murein DD-endopeptidase MepM/ murein hydrolase activator NlpD
MECFRNERKRRIAILTGSVAFFMGLSNFFMQVSPVNAQNVPDYVVCYSVFNVESKAEMKELANQYQTTVSAITKQSSLISLGNRLSVTVKDKKKDIKKTSRGQEISWIWPVKGEISSEYGFRNGDFHHGLDIAAPRGSSIRTVQSGVVVKTGRNGVYGLFVIVEHEGGVQTLYAHNSKILVETGDTVKKGEKISLSGNTGNSTGPHLHFEIRVDGKTINPKNYLPARA